MHKVIKFINYWVGRLPLSLMESLLFVDFLYFCVTLTRNVSNDTCFCPLLRISRKYDIALSLNRVIARNATALLGWCFSTNFYTVFHILHTSLISFEERDVSVFFSSSSDEITIISCCCSRLQIHS
jgi:hypothetical protein